MLPAAIKKKMESIFGRVGAFGLSHERRSTWGEKNDILCTEKEEAPMSHQLSLAA